MTAPTGWPLPPTTNTAYERPASTAPTPTLPSAWTSSAPLVSGSRPTCSPISTALVATSHATTAPTVQASVTGTGACVPVVTAATSNRAPPRSTSRRFPSAVASQSTTIAATPAAMAGSA